MLEDAAAVAAPQPASYAEALGAFEAGKAVSPELAMAVPRPGSSAAAQRRSLSGPSEKPQRAKVALGLSASILSRAAPPPVIMVLGSPRGRASEPFGGSPTSLTATKRRARELLVPIEETLNRRRELQQCMSAPGTLLAADGNPGEGNSLLQSCCMKLCSWEHKWQGGVGDLLGGESLDSWLGSSVSLESMAVAEDRPEERPVRQAPEPPPPPEQPVRKPKLPQWRKQRQEPQDEQQPKVHKRRSLKEPRHKEEHRPEQPSNDDQHHGQAQLDEQLQRLEQLHQSQHQHHFHHRQPPKKVKKPKQHLPHHQPQQLDFGHEPSLSDLPLLSPAHQETQEQHQRQQPSPQHQQQHQQQLPPQQQPQPQPQPQPLKQLQQPQPQPQSQQHKQQPRQEQEQQLQRQPEQQQEEQQQEEQQQDDSPRDGQSRPRPLPADIVGRIRSEGWALKGVQVTCWVQQALALASKQSLASSSADFNPSTYRETHKRLLLLEHLQQESMHQGLRALRAALQWRCGGVERAFRCLDVNGHGDRITLLEFAAGLCLLGLDAPALCGASEVEVFRMLDSDGDGRLHVLDLVRGEAAGRRLISSSDEETEAAERWVLVAKFVALSSWYQTPQAIRRRGSINPNATHSAADDVNQNPANDPVRSSWYPVHHDLVDLQQRLREEFQAQATVRQFDELLLSREDFFRFLRATTLAGGSVDPVGTCPSRVELARIYEEAFAGQLRRPPVQRGRMPTKGLTFQSFAGGPLLRHVALAVGLHLRHLVEDAISAQERAAGVKAKAGKKM